MEKPLLNDPDIYPDEGVLSNTLGHAYPVFNALMTKISGEPLVLVPTWRYYKDGHAWLCKVIHKKKTVFWLSVWEGHLKITFYFTAKTGTGIADLDIDKGLIQTFRKSKPIGKLIPLTIPVNRNDQIEDVLKIAAYKMSLK